MPSLCPLRLNSQSEEGTMKANDTEWPEMRLHPVGMVRNDISKPMMVANDDDLELRERIEKVRENRDKVRNTVSELLLEPEMAELLEGVEDFSHILVIYWPHLVPPERRKLKKVHPMGRKDLPIRGIFSACSPARPNPILITAVRLLERNGTVLRVQGLDAVDGSPILDIKPYVRSYMGVENPVVADWMEKINKELEDDPAAEDVSS